MSRNQQIIILIVAILISVGLVVGAYMKKKSNSARHNTPVTATAPTPAIVPPAPVKHEDKFAVAPPVKRVLPKEPTPLGPNKIYKPNPVVEMTSSVRTVVAEMRILSVSITAAIMRNRMDYGDLEQLDFSGGRDNPSDFGVFNPEGVLLFRGLLNKWIDQDTLDEVTSQPGQSIWYSLRRVQGTDKILDVLYAVIPNPSAGMCAATRFHFSLADNLQFANDNGTPVTDRAGFIPADAQKMPSCLFTPDKKSFYFYPLRSRMLRANSKTWQAPPQ